MTVNAVTYISLCIKMIELVYPLEANFVSQFLLDFAPKHIYA